MSLFIVTASFAKTLFTVNCLKTRLLIIAVASLVMLLVAMMQTEFQRDRLHIGKDTC